MRLPIPDSCVLLPMFHSSHDLYAMCFDACNGFLVTVHENGDLLGGRVENWDAHPPVERAPTRV